MVFALRLVIISTNAKEWMLENKYGWLMMRLSGGQACSLRLSKISRPTWTGHARGNLSRVVTLTPPIVTMTPPMWNYYGLQGDGDMSCLSD